MPRSQIAALITLISMAWPCLASEVPPVAASPKGFDFGRKVLWVRMRTNGADGRFTVGFLERAEIRRYGESAFLVGTIREAQTGAKERPKHGVTIWLPLAELAELAEFNNWGEVEALPVDADAVGPNAELRELATDSQEVQSVAISSRRFRIPIQVDWSETGGVAKAILFRSQDEGKTWRPVAEASPGESAFNMAVEEDGLHWFAVQAIAKDGRKWPAEPNGLRPARKVMVNNPFK
jgi:hypothetical protein